MTDKAVNVMASPFSDFPALEGDAQNDAFEYVRDIEGVPENIWDEYSLVYYGTWSTFEEHGSLLILQKDDQYFTLEGGYSVMSECNSEETWADLECVTNAEAIRMANEFQEDSEDNDICLC